ncbi:hypothetical protein [Oceanobacillus halophilus]|uniref:Uncharacterized protein n=1 Tax=Oceanobacillus halophilus TaxID=930130 RepID=A0A494ZZD5_9BACI|nr:hypothetical protein [Oceanobacillus halophilus]RKQ32305.1 hypothetical protein D8M06_13065 [Oceanobacillus halophilus]
MNNLANNLLVEAVNKQLELQLLPGWRDELLLKAPPILWFGDCNTNKAKIITIGANPSREEFLDLHKAEAKLLKENELRYLKKPRFRALEDNEALQDIITSTHLQNEVINSFNGYFSRNGNPYTNWFGKAGGFKVEAFLNGFGASFYTSNNYEYTGIHLDLFPFATISDFKEIRIQAEKDLFINNWAQNFLFNLLQIVSPEPTVIISFGRTNFNYLRDIFRENILIQHSKKRIHLNKAGDRKSSTYWIGKFNQHTLIGLSVNLGNPRNFTIKNLQQYGKDLKNEIG